MGFKGFRVFRVQNSGIWGMRVQGFEDWGYRVLFFRVSGREVKLFHGCSTMKARDMPGFRNWLGS